MKIIVFGASGGVGRQIVTLARADGHQVTAFVRSAGKVKFEDGVEVVSGDVLDPAAVERAVRGHDAVVAAIGTPALKRTTARSEGTRNIVRAMEKTGVERLVSLSSMGIGDSREMLPFEYKYILVPLLLRQGFAEHELQEQTIKASRTRWTIVRPGAFNDAPRTGAYQHGLMNKRGVRAKISRADVADFMVRQLKDETYLLKTPWVCY